MPYLLHPPLLWRGAGGEAQTTKAILLFRRNEGLVLIAFWKGAGAACRSDRRRQGEVRLLSKKLRPSIFLISFIRLGDLCVLA